MIAIRKAMQDDAKGIAFVHVESWKTTYKGIVDESDLAKLNIAQRTAQWNQIVTIKDEVTFIAAENEKIVGFANAGLSRDRKDFDSELYAIYILQENQQQQIGKKLFLPIAQELKLRGAMSLFVWVLKDNSSKSFYQKLQGKWIEEKTIQIGNQYLIEEAYGWENLDELIKKLVE